MYDYRMGGSLGEKGCYQLVKFILVLFGIVEPAQLFQVKSHFINVLSFAPYGIADLIRIYLILIRIYFT